MTATPPAAHLASVAPQPNSTSSGWAPIASARAGRDRSVAGADTEIEAAEVGGDVDVEGEGSVADHAEPEAEPPGLGGVAAERARALREAGRHAHRAGDHGGAVVTVAGDDRDDRAAAVARQRRQGARERKVCVCDHGAGTAARLHPCPPGGGRFIERARVVDDVESACARPVAHVGSARHDDCRELTRCRAHPIGERAGERGASLVVEVGGQPRLPQCERSHRDHDARAGHPRLRNARHTSDRMRMRMLPAVEPVYSVARTVLLPPLHYGMQWTIEGAHLIPPRGPVILASNHTSYLDPLALAYLADRRHRRVRFLTKAELFDKQPLGFLLHQIHQIPVVRNSPSAAGSLELAVDALTRGECVAIFPEGTISLDLEPMAGKSGAARLAAQSGVPVTPVGLWGAHRTLFKGRKPHWRWGVAETAVVGPPVRV